MTNISSKSHNKKRLKGDLSENDVQYSNLLKRDHFSGEKSQNKSQKSDSHIIPKNKEKESRSIKKKQNNASASMANEEAKHTMALLNMDDHINDTMKKTLEENNKEREINIFNDDHSSRYNHSLKYVSAPVSNKHSDAADSIFSNSMKLAAFRASELKKRNRKLIMKYGSRDMMYNSRFELDFIKKLHNAALTIQN